MKKNELSKITTLLPSKLGSILKKINENSLGILFIVDKDFKLLASISDGDIRRIFLNKKNNDLLITEDSSAINKNPVSLPSNCDIQEIQKLLNTEINGKTIRCIPLIDEQNRIVDYSTRERARKYSVLEPIIGEEELFNVIDVIKSGWISSKGSYISKFENSFSSYLSGGYSVAVTSGTTALQVGLTTLGIASGDEVVVPNFTFGASINSIINCGAKPVIAEVEEETWTIDPKKIENYISPLTKAIMLVHIYGQPCKIDEIKKIAKKNDLLIIEDCAEAVGAKYKGKIIGTDGDCSCFSFFANKTITTGEGGMVVFKDEKLASKARLLINHGLSSKIKYYHEVAGYNFRMTNMQAAIGVAQMKKIEFLINKRKEIFKIYDDRFKDIPEITLLPKNEWSENSYWLYTLLIKDISKEKRDKLLNRMQNKGIECRPGFYSLNLMEPFKKFAKGDYNISNKLSESSISLPTSSIDKIDQDFISETLLSEIENINKC
jgi:perosamine synthetase